MTFNPGFIGRMAGFIETQLIFDELKGGRKQRARDLIREFNEQTGFPEFNAKDHLREPQDNISESQVLEIESDIRKIMGEVK